ncbi:MAG: metallophosphoesterase family protein [Bacteroidales bacterium]|nr:metallophosphoesterase family protein [Bacteroidales bacterium]
MREHLHFILCLTLIAALFASCSQNAKYEPAAQLHFNENGRFKILQLTDTHYIAGDQRSQRALDCIEEMLDEEKPDFVIHTGDIIFGAPAAQGVQELFTPLVERGIPFAITLGNHDGQFDLNRDEVYKAVCSIPGCVNRPASEKGITGNSNDCITLSSGKGIEFVFYLLDSGDLFPMPEEEKPRRCYDFIHFDQIEWYRTLSLRFKKGNNGAPVPSIAFFHIPLPEIASLAKKPSAVITGNNEESPCPSKINSGLYAQMRELQDVFAIAGGHDHDCDYVLDYGPIAFIYGRYSGGDTVYNHLGADGRSDEKLSGARVFEFTTGQPGFDTWVRLQGGLIQQPLHIEP